MPRQRVKPTEPKPKRQRSGLTPTDLALLDRVIAEKCTAKTIWGASVKATRSEALRMLCWQALGLFVAKEPGSEAPKAPGLVKDLRWQPGTATPPLPPPLPGTGDPVPPPPGTGDPPPWLTTWLTTTTSP